MCGTARQIKKLVPRTLLSAWQLNLLSADCSLSLALHPYCGATRSCAAQLDGNGRLSLAELESHFASREGPSFSAAAVANIFRTLTVGGDVKEEVTRSESRGAFVRYRAMRLALGLRSAVSDA